MGSALLLLVISFDHRRCFLLTFFGGCWFFRVVDLLGYFFGPWGVEAVVPCTQWTPRSSEVPSLCGGAFGRILDTT